MTGIVVGDRHRVTSFWEPEVLRRVVAIFALISVLVTPVKGVAGYAGLADLTLAAPIIVRATLTGSERLAPAQSPGIAGGRVRLLVRAQVLAALTAPGPIPASLNYLWDAPLDARGKAPKPKGETVLLFLSAVDAEGKARLATPSAQRSWDAAEEATVRAIAAEARAAGVPVITGVASGFHAAGGVVGESESQFFLSTADGRGITLVVTERPGERRRVAIARGDVIDESAAPIRRDTLLWYRLACALPAKLPAGAGNDPALATDYAAAIASLGACDRAL